MGGECHIIYSITQDRRLLRRTRLRSILRQRGEMNACETHDN